MADSPSQTLHFAPETLEAMAREVFRASGSPEAEADLIARRLVASNLGGHDSHGIIRVYSYLEWLRDGVVVPGVTPTLIRDDGATALVDGHWGYGQVAAEEAMRQAIARARAHGVAAVGVRRLMHVGRLADYAISAAREGLVSLVSTATAGAHPIVAPFGGIEGRMATNPFAAGFPSRDHEPVFFDMASSVMAEGKLRVARDAGKAVAPDLIIDPEGRPTTDPEGFYGGGAILPLGGREKGYKGYLLAFLVEVLAGLLTGAGYAGKEEQPRFDNCTFMIALDVERFRPLGDLQAEIDHLIRHLKATPGRPGEEVLYPGEVERRTEAERRAGGIPLAAETVRKLQAELDRYGVPIRLAEQALAPLPRA